MPFQTVKCKKSNVFLEDVEPGGNNDRRADEQARGRYVAPDRKAEHRRPDQRQIVEGTTAEGGASDRERVHQYCAIPFPMPAKASATKSSQAGGVNPNGT